MITVEYRKHPDTLHWNYEAELLGDDEFGTWLGVPTGTELRKGTEPAKAMEGFFVQCVAPGRWWTVVRNTEHRTSHYVDIITPAVWERTDYVTMVDLDLDVVRLTDGTVMIEDEDEFLLHQTSLAYPDFWVDKARVTAADVHIALEGLREPFGRVADGWLALMGGRS
ncbi:MAG: DUF402 domain-containing protein [Acidimicrobiia bacterium]|nr:DUF402 domain-containing protein [Acidimicrobiia bacterium]